VKFKRQGQGLEKENNSDNSRHARGKPTMNQPVEEKEERKVKSYQGGRTKAKRSLRGSRGHFI
jgi:hypothetical protein